MHSPRAAGNSCPSLSTLDAFSDGIFKTVNGGEIWRHIEFPPKKIDCFIIDRREPDKRMFASGVLYGMGKIFRSEDNGGNWTEVYSEPGAGTSVTSLSQDSKDTDILFAGTSGGTVIKSIDGGGTWKNIGQRIVGPVTDIQFDSMNKFSVYALSYGKKRFYSSNGGEEWIDWEEKKKEEIKTLKKRESDLRKGKRTGEADNLKKQIEAIEKRNREEKMPGGIVSITASPIVSGTIYAGTQKGELYISSDFGKYWKKINIIESASKFAIRMITASFASRNELSFIAGMAFYNSQDSGNTWKVTQINVDRPVAVISYDPKDSNVIVFGIE